MFPFSGSNDEQLLIEWATCKCQAHDKLRWLTKHLQFRATNSSFLEIIQFNKLQSALRTPT